MNDTNSLADLLNLTDDATVVRRDAVDLMGLLGLLGALVATGAFQYGNIDDLVERDLFYYDEDVERHMPTEKMMRSVMPTAERMAPRAIEAVVRVLVGDEYEAEASLIKIAEA